MRSLFSYREWLKTCRRLGLDVLSFQNLEVARTVSPMEYHLRFGTGHGGRISRARASLAEGRAFESRPSETNDFQIDTCRYLARRNSIIRIGQGLAYSVSK